MIRWSSNNKKNHRPVVLLFTKDTFYWIRVHVLITKQYVNIRTIPNTFPGPPPISILCPTAFHNPKTLMHGLGTLMPLGMRSRNPGWAKVETTKSETTTRDLMVEQKKLSTTLYLLGQVFVLCVVLIWQRSK